LGNDLSDIQWRLYREGLPKLAAALAIFVAVARMLAKCKEGTTHYSRSHHAWRLAGGLLLIAGLHGSKALHVLVLVLVYFQAVYKCAGQRNVGPVVVWGLPMLAWLAVRLLDGLPFKMLSPHAAWLDRLDGPVRWHIGFNMVILRMISWGMDLHWARLHRRGFSLPFGVRWGKRLCSASCVFVAQSHWQVTCKAAP
jgi:protein-cysteine N-palmitoyltransferase HHAT